MGRCPSPRTLSRYADGDLSPASAERVRRHVCECRGCKAILRRTRVVEAALRWQPPASPGSPDVAGPVVKDLRQRGAFLGARVAAARRRVFGERTPVRRAASLVAMAVAVVMATVVGLDRVTRNDWARDAGPVLSDCERVLSLVVVDQREHGALLAAARDEARALNLSNRLAATRERARPPVAADLVDLEEAFAVLASGGDLSPEVAERFRSGDLLRRTERLREGLAMAR
jgi:anti-sigma factor RsiW